MRKSERSGPLWPLFSLCIFQTPHKFPPLISIYGDFRYDVAKLAHSVVGLYDFIIGGMFNYQQNAPYDILLEFEQNATIKNAQNYFCSKKFGGYSLHELSTYPILVHLFLSMLPLHHDFPERQNAMLANALRLYSDFIKQ